MGVRRLFEGKNLADHRADLALRRFCQRLLDELVFIAGTAISERNGMVVMSRAFAGGTGYAAPLAMPWGR